MFAIRLKQTRCLAMTVTSILFSIYQSLVAVTKMGNIFLDIQSWYICNTDMKYNADVTSDTGNI